MVGSERIEFRAEKLGFYYPMAYSRDIVDLLIIATPPVTNLALLGEQLGADFADDPVGGARCCDRPLSQLSL